MGRMIGAGLTDVVLCSIYIGVPAHYFFSVTFCYKRRPCKTLLCELQCGFVHFQQYSRHDLQKNWAQPSRCTIAIAESDKIISRNVELKICGAPLGREGVKQS